MLLLLYVECLCDVFVVHCTVYCFRTAEQLWHPVYSHFDGSAMAGKLNQVTFTNAFGCFLDLSSDTARVLSKSGGLVFILPC